MCVHSFRNYQKIERGVLDPRLSTLRRLADAFDVSLSEFLEGVWVFLSTNGSGRPGAWEACDSLSAPG